MTGPIILPNYGEQLGEAFARIGASLSNIISPYREERAAFRKAIAANPQILQTLRDMAETNPEAVFNENMSKFIPQDILDTISSLEPSPEARLRKAGTGALSTFTPEQLTALGLGNILKMTPTAAARELAVAPAIPTVAGQEPGEVGPTARERGAFLDITGQPVEEGAKGVVQGDLIRLAGLYLSSLPVERRAQIGAYQSLPTLISDEHFMKQLALQEEMWRARNRDRINDTMARLAEQNIIWWQQTTGTGTTDAWRLFFSDQDRKRLEALSGEDPRRPVTSLTPEDRELLEVQRAFQAAPAEKRALDLNRADSGIRQLIIGIDKTDDASVRAGLIAGLNMQLLNKARITGTPPYHAAWAAGEAARGLAKGGPSAPLRGVGGLLSRFKKLRFYDAQNNEVSAEEIEASSLLEPPTNTRGLPGGGTSGVSPAPQTSRGAGAPPPAPTKTKAQRWDELRREMFPNVQLLTPAQVNAVTARVNAEMGP